MHLRQKDILFITVLCPKLGWSRTPTQDSQLQRWPCDHPARKPFPKGSAQGLLPTTGGAKPGRDSAKTCTERVASGRPLGGPTAQGGKHRAHSQSPGMSSRWEGPGASWGMGETRSAPTEPPIKPSALWEEPHLIQRGDFQEVDPTDISLSNGQLS